MISVLSTWDGIFRAEASLWVTGRFTFDNQERTSIVALRYTIRPIRSLFNGD